MGRWGFRFRREVQAAFDFVQEAGSGSAVSLGWEWERARGLVSVLV